MVSSAALGSSSKVDRVNLEPIYTQLKAALGDNWAEYKLALSHFVRGENMRMRYNQHMIANPLHRRSEPVRAVMGAAAHSFLDTLRYPVDRPE